jgi:hypothetical protein
MSLNCCHQLVYCLSPRWYMSMGNRSGMLSDKVRTTEELGEERVLMLLLPPQISHRLTWARTRISVVRCRGVSAWTYAIVFFILLSFRAGSMSEIWKGDFKMEHQLELDVILRYLFPVHSLYIDTSNANILSTCFGDVKCVRFSNFV